jgi:hypothetical protein
MLAQDWNDGVELTADRLRRYGKLGRRTPPKELAPGTLKKILGKTAKHSSAAGEAAIGSVARFWVDGTKGFVSSETEAVVGEETNWDRFGYGWYATRTATIRKGDRLLLLDRTSKPGWATLFNVVGSTRTVTATPDGWYFAAHKQVPRRSRRKMTKQFLAKLAKAGVGATDGSRVELVGMKRKRVDDLFR